MTDNLNSFATWVFSAITTVWNFCVANSLIQWFLGFAILQWIVDHYKKYFGR